VGRRGEVVPVGYNSRRQRGGRRHKTTEVYERAAGSLRTALHFNGPRTRCGSQDEGGLLGGGLTVPGSPLAVGGLNRQVSIAEAIGDEALCSFREDNDPGRVTGKGGNTGSRSPR